jgi:hypothetical protein
VSTAEGPLRIESLCGAGQDGVADRSFGPLPAAAAGPDTPARGTEVRP